VKTQLGGPALSTLIEHSDRLDATKTGHSLETVRCAYSAAASCDAEVMTLRH
jgi:hypothetical protein